VAPPECCFASSAMAAYKLNWWCMTMIKLWYIDSKTALNSEYKSSQFTFGLSGLQFSTFNHVMYHLQLVKWKKSIKENILQKYYHCQCKSLAAYTLVQILANTGRNMLSMTRQVFFWSRDHWFSSWNPRSWSYDPWAQSWSCKRWDVCQWHTLYTM